MKEKRYFCDYFDDSKSTRCIILILIFSLILITFISIISYKVNMSKYEYELNSYSVETYEHLDEIANNVIKKGVGIDVFALPDDVIEYKITSTNDEIIFEIYLDNNKDMRFADSANMTVKMLKDYTITSKWPNYSSEEEYVENIKFLIGLNSFVSGILAWIIILVVILIVCEIGIIISASHKNQNLS